LVVLFKIKTSAEKKLIQLLLLKLKYVSKNIKWKKYAQKTQNKISKLAFGKLETYLFRTLQFLLLYKTNMQMLKVLCPNNHNIDTRYR